MKNSALASLLAGAVIVCALTTAWLSTQYYFSMRELQKLQAQYVSMNNSRTAVQALANDALEYSKKNPAIDPLLYQFEIKARPGSNAVASPSPSLRK